MFNEDGDVAGGVESVYKATVGNWAVAAGEVGLG